jgi:segregation and condensation protein A
LAYQVRLDNFTGPFDLLCHLIENAKLDICAIAIAQVVDQYIAYVRSAQDFADLDSVGEFLVLATRLLLIKTKILLPNTCLQQQDQNNYDADIDTEQLVEHLRQYRVFRDLGRRLGEFMEEESAYTAVGPISVDSDVPQTQMVVVDPPKLELDDIVSTWIHLRPLFSQPRSVSIFPDRPTVEEEILVLKRYLNNRQPPFSFNRYLGKTPHKFKLVTMLLAILELWRQDQVRVWQTEIFGDIYVAKKEDRACRSNH